MTKVDCKQKDKGGDPKPPVPPPSPADPPKKSDCPGGKWTIESADVYYGVVSALLGGGTINAWGNARCDSDPTKTEDFHLWGSFFGLGLMTGFQGHESFSGSVTGAENTDDLFGSYDGSFSLLGLQVGIGYNYTTIQADIPGKGSYSLSDWNIFGARVEIAGGSYIMEGYLDN